MRFVDSITNMKLKSNSKKKFKHQLNSIERNSSWGQGGTTLHTKGMQREYPKRVLVKTSHELEVKDLLKFIYQKKKKKKDLLKSSSWYKKFWDFLINFGIPYATIKIRRCTNPITSKMVVPINRAVV